jgi:hypothetical protein
MKTLPIAALTGLAVMLASALLRFLTAADKRDRAQAPATAQAAAGG